MIKLKDIIKEGTAERIGGGHLLIEAGIEKSYKAIMDLEKEILNMEKTFKREKKGMVKDRAKNMEKSIKNLKMCWNRLYADTQER